MSADKNWQFELEEYINLILGTDYELKNRYMHVDYVPEQSDRTVQ